MDSDINKKGDRYEQEINDSFLKKVFLYTNGVKLQYLFVVCFGNISCPWGCFPKGF